MTPPTLKQIIEKATPGPLMVTDFAQGSEVPTAGTVYVWSASQLPRSDYNDIATFHAQGPMGAQQANAELYARCSPSVMLAVVEKLESIREAVEKQKDYCAAREKNCAPENESHWRGEAQYWNAYLEDVESALNALNGKAP